MCRCIGTLTAFATLSSSLFRSFAGHLNPSFRPPCSHTIRKITRVMKYMIQRKIILQLMTSAQFFGFQPFMSASVDLWTSKHANMGYGALDVQFGNPGFGISEATLGVGVLPGTHSGEAIANWVTECVKQYEELEGETHAFSLTPKSMIKLAVIDGGANVMLAFKLLSLSILYCFAHKLHLCVKRSIGLYGKPDVCKETKELTEKHRKQVTHFSKSPKNSNLLIDLQIKQLGRAKGALRPVQDVVTRWTSTASSWMRTLVLRTFLVSFFTQHDPKGSFANTLSASDYNKLRGLLAVINPARGLTEFLQV